MVITTTDRIKLDDLAAAAEAEGLTQTASMYRMAAGEAHMGYRQGLDAGRCEWRGINSNPWLYDTIGHINWREGFYAGRAERRI